MADEQTMDTQNQDANQAAYALVGLMTSYDIDPHWSEWRICIRGILRRGWFDARNANLPALHVPGHAAQHRSRIR